MEILGIGPLEALFVLILALLVIGPRDLGKTARSFGRFLNRLYRSEAWGAITEASRNLRRLPNRLAREAALEELDEARAELKQAGKGVRQEIDRFGEELKASRGGAKPAEAGHIGQPDPERPATAPADDRRGDRPPAAEQPPDDSPHPS